MQTPLVSIIIPCYNAAAFVEKAILSITKQTYRHLEICIINDASTDGSLHVIESIKDPRIRIFNYQENTKKIGCVNEVLAQCNGDFIAFQDADDWSDLTRIEKQLGMFAKNTALGICFTNYFKVQDGKLSKPGKIALSNEELREEFLSFGQRPSHISPTHCGTMMIKREVFEKLGGYHPYFKGRVAEDIYWVYNILKFYEGITLNERLNYYRSHPGSLTFAQIAGQNPKAAYTWILVKKIIQENKKRGIDTLNSADKQLLQALELEACEEALVNSIRENSELKRAYEGSSSYRVGQMLLFPFHKIKKLFL